MRTLLLALLLTACAPKQGLTLPGSTRHVGSRPPPELSQDEEGPWRRAGVAASSETSRPDLALQDNSSAAQVVRAAQSSVTQAWRKVEGKTYRDDCSGLVCALHARADIDLEHRNTAALFELAKELDVHHRRQVPSPGDVVFFDDTHDRNGNGRLDDDLTHLAVVEKVRDDGTLTLVHRGSKGVSRIWMNLSRPDEHADAEGQVLNSFLRVRTAKDPRGTKYLAGQLWRGGASFWQAGDLVADAG